MNIYLDECGYSGENLSNKDQTVFAIATHNFSEAECSAFKAKYFARVQAPELKHKDLCKSYDKRILEFVSDVLTNHKARVKFGLVHKRFALACKLVDEFLEPAMKASGFDLYERGGNLATANMLYLIIPVMIGQQFIDVMLDRFEVLVREKTPEHYDAFIEHLTKVPKKKGGEFVEMIHNTCLMMGKTNVLSLLTEEKVLDICMTTALNVMAAWRTSTEEEIILIHDESKNMEEWKAYWDAVTAKDVPAQKVGWDRRTMVYPIAIERTDFVSSKSSLCIQIADVLSGSICRAFRYGDAKTPNDVYGKAALEAYAKGNVEPDGLIWPQLAVTPEALNTIGPKHADPNDFLSSVLQLKGV